jgi:hypothetical protein
MQLKYVSTEKVEPPSTSEDSKREGYLKAWSVLTFIVRSGLTTVTVVGKELENDPAEYLLLQPICSARGYLAKT